MPSPRSLSLRSPYIELCVTHFRSRFRLVEAVETVVSIAAEHVEVIGFGDACFVMPIVALRVQSARQRVTRDDRRESDVLSGRGSCADRERFDAGSTNPLSQLHGTSLRTVEERVVSRSPIRF